jgi:pyruvate kinase
MSININKEYSLTKIVATLGPATETYEAISSLIEAGMNVARLNCSHGDWDVRAQRIENIRKASANMQRPIGILADLQGPKIRTGIVPGEGINVDKGEEIILVIDENQADYSDDSSVKKLFIKNYLELPQDVSIGQRILLDDGVIRLKVKEIKGNDVHCEVIFGGLIRSNKGVNLPESSQKNLEAITKKDKEDLIEAVKHKVEFIALSFVKTAADIRYLKQLIAEANSDEHPIKIVAKIEKPQALDHLDEILDVVDGVMVARGDLGVELEPERVPVVQKEIIRKANLKKKFVITATQMMDSMISKPFPTRAEVSDVANAILDGTDAVMLSNETAMGSFPYETVDQMRKIALEIEKNGDIRVQKIDLFEMDPNLDNINHLAMAQSVENLAKLAHVKTILCFSCSGASATLISKLKPKSRIIAATTYDHTYNYLSIVWGVMPIYFDQVQQTTQTIYNIENHLIEEGLVEQDETIIITGGLPIAARGPSNFVKVHKCDGSIHEKSIKKLSIENTRKLGPLKKKLVSA